VENRIKIGATILLLLAVVYIFALPAVDLGPTALRASRQAALVFVGMGLAASALNPGRPTIGPLLTPTDHPALPVADLIDLTCIRTC
jgi:hypothetical protein